MRKCAKRIFAWLMAVAMVLSVSDPVMAADKAEHTEAAVAGLQVDGAEVAALASAGVTDDPHGELCFVHWDANGDGALTNKDALYVLGNVMYGEEEYPLDQDYDVNGDKAINAQDAIALLYCSVWPDTYGDRYHWQGAIHSYEGEPIWVWAEDNSSVEARFYCSCKAEDAVEKVVAGGSDIRAAVTQKATCTEAGSRELTATVSFRGKTYTGKKSEIIPATGHDFGTAPASCTEARSCVNEGCDYVEPVKGHSYVKDNAKTVKATCTEPEMVVYTCAKCGASTEPEKSGEANGHTLGELQEEKANVASASIASGSVASDACKWVQFGVCSVCGKNVEVGAIYKHNCKAVIVKAATCTAPGLKSYECSVCGANHAEDSDGVPADEVIPVDANAHTWVEKAVNGSKITYVCAECGEEKTAVVSDSDTAEVSKVDLKDSELALSIQGETNKATVKLDQGTLDTLADDKDVTISATTVDKGKLANIGQEALDQIGDNKVYNFTMKSGEDSVTDFGETGGKENKVTISLPYELQQDDDPDCIDIWYVTDSGELEVCEGKYSNGYVTFATNHFSYYTITRLTAKQRCDAYGHKEVTLVVPPSCEEEGYTVTVCARCGERTVSDTTPKKGHDLKEVSTVKATCNTAGSRTEKCASCDKVVVTVISATGHKWTEDKVEPATCTAAGSQKYVCGNDGCDASYEDVIPVKGHQLDSRTVAPTCETRGYTQYTCKREGCGYEYRDKEVAALGHDYSGSFAWNDDLSQAVLTLECGNCGDIVVKDAAIEEKITQTTTCETGGAVEYVAKVSHNRKLFSDTKKTTSQPSGHKLPADYEKDAKSHFKTCEKCGEKIDAADHVWSDPYVVRAATCVDDGAVSYKCKVCGYVKTETIPMSGAHDFDPNGICSVCGFKQMNCNHDSFHVETISLSDQSGVCKDSVIKVYTCDCGEVISNIAIGGGCRPEYVYDVVPDGKGGFEDVTEITCSVCGLSVRNTSKCVAVEGAACAGVMDTTSVVKKGNKEIRSFNYQSQELKHPMSKVVNTVAPAGACGENMVLVSCACGENTRIDFSNTKCDWVWMPGDEETEVKICSECHVIRSRSAVLSADGKTMSYSMSYKNTEGKVLASLVAKDKCYGDRGDCVDFDMEYLLKGDSCEDGIAVVTICKDCGRKTENVVYGHHWPNYETVYDLSKDGVGCKVVVQRCLCGERNVVVDDEDGCEWVWSGYDEETGKDFFTCDKCGAVRESSEWMKEIGPGCYDVRRVGNITYKNKNGKIALSVDTAELASKHPIVKRDVTLLGDSCKDGVLIKTTCSVCKNVEAWYTDYHELDVKESYDLADYGLCGGVAELMACACGEMTDIRAEEFCDWIGQGWSEADGCEIWVCAKCGAVRKFRHEVVNKDAKCFAHVKETVVYVGKDGRKLELVREYDGTNHNFDYEKPSFVGQVKNCEDGYEVIFTCRDCGAAQKEKRAYHERYPVERYDFKADFGFCGGSVTKYSCACGAEQHLYFEGDPCKWRNVSYDKNTNTQVDQCSECGVTRIWSRTEGEKDSDCFRVQDIKYAYIDANDQKVLELEARNKFRSHNFGDIAFSMQGSSCEDGYYYTATCKDCGETERGYNRYHQVFTLKAYDLADYGYACGGTIEETACPCGENHGIRWNDRCDWENYQYDPATRTATYTCSKCGGVRTETVYEGSGSGCVTYGTRTYTFGTGEKSFSLTQKAEFWHHDFEVADIKKDGDPSAWQSCEDGYTVTEVCKICGFENVNHRNWHESYLEWHYDLAEEGVPCGGELELWKCVCGENRFLRRNENCRWIWSGGGDQDTQKAECEKCHTVRTVTYNRGEQTGCQQPVVETYRYTAADGTLLLTVDYDTVYRLHDWDYRFEAADGGSEIADCENGYYVRGVCRRCGQELNDNYVYTNHNTYKTESYDLGRLGMCDGRLEVWKCPCGKESYASKDETCDWKFIGSENSAEIYRCSVCGITRSRTQVEGVSDGCFVPATEYYVYTREGSGDPEVVLTYEWKGTYTRHEWDYHFENLAGNPVTNCEDGYRRTGVCKKCGEQMKDNGIYYEHYTYKSGELVLPEEDGFCGGVVEMSGCACGKMQYLDDYRQSGCDWVFDPRSGANYTWIYHCSRCNATKTQTEVRGPLDGCSGSYTKTLTYQNADGTKTLTCSCVGTYFEHDWDYRFESVDGGSTVKNCESGYYEKGTCRRCGEILDNTQLIKEHRNYPMARYDLSELGMCGGWIELGGCACGEQEYMNWDWNECRWETVSYENSVEVAKCPVCGTVRTITRTRGVPDGCYVPVKEVYSFTREKNGVTEKLLSVERNTVYPEHEWAYSFESAKGGPVTNCEEGYYEKGTCVRCGEFLDNTNMITYHQTYKTDRYDLSELGMCGGWIELSSCPCGELDYMSWNEDCQWEFVSYENSTYVHKCSVCGTVRTEMRQEGVPDGCNVPVKEIYSYTRVTNGVTEDLLTIERDTAYPRHDWDYSYESVKGGPVTNCEDGYYQKAVCKVCGEKMDNTTSYNNHVSMQTKRVELADYGLCGGVIDYYSCACGRVHSESFYNEMCNWEPTYSDTTGAVRTDKYKCTVCGGTKEVETTEGAEVNGEIPVTMVTVLKDSKGNIVETVTDTFNRIPIN